MLTPFIDYNHTIEQNVLAVCLQHTDVYAGVQHLLSAECFHHDGHRHLYDAIVQVWQNGMMVDSLSVTQQLYTNGLREIDGLSPAAFTGTLCNDAFATPNLAQWCVQLRELAARRAIIRITRTSLTNGDVTELAAEMQQLLNEAMQVCTVNDWHSAYHTAALLCRHIESETTQHDNDISTTFRTIDEANGGLRPGQLAVLGARPSVGKSALAGGIALAAALQGRQVGFISMEMPAQELFARLVSHHTGTRYSAIERAPKTGKALLESIQNMAHLPLHFADSASLTIHDIRARAEQLKRTHGLHLLVVDYLQLVAEHGDSKRSREQNISAISRGLKMIAMNLQVPVLALSQLNRESEHRANKRPTLADLRESGAIEQDADIVMLLHRDYRSGILYTNEGHSTMNHADLVIAKWRNGSCFDLKLHFEPETMRFREAPG